MRLSVESSFQKSAVDPSAALRGNLSTRAELHHFRLNKHFPKQVKEVLLEQSDGKLIANIHFINGHVLRRPEAELASTEFLALCAMLYDLPPKGR